MTVKLKCNKKDKNYNIDNKLKVLDVYMQEYIHRDNRMWDLSLKFFFASLTVILLPTLDIMNIPERMSKNLYFFPIIGIGLAIIFLIVSLHQVKRFIAVSKTYSRIVNSLPKSIKREKIKSPTEISICYPLFISMFIALIILAIYMIIIYIGISYCNYAPCTCYKNAAQYELV